MAATEATSRPSATVFMRHSVRQLAVFGKVCEMERQRRGGRGRGDAELREGAKGRSVAFAFFSAFFAISAGFAFSVSAQQQALTPPQDPAAVDRGRMLLSQECGFCHGANARGGSSGPDLTR